MTTKDQFLGNLRRRLGGGTPHNLAHPIPERPDDQPRPAFPRAGEVDQAAVLLDTAAEKGWAVRRLTERAEGDALIEALLASHPIRSAVITREMEAEAFGEILAERGVTVETFSSPEQAARADLGVTGARFGVAGTGSVVVDTDRIGGRSVSLLPPVHLAVVQAPAVVATPAEVWSRMPEHFPDGPPSQVVWITGPSRSGDIEFTLTVGVHGPKAAWLAIVG